MRAVAGVVVGVAVWWTVFLLSTFLIVALWPASEELRHAIFEDRNYSVLPTAMLAMFLFMYLPIGLVSGFVTAAITKKRWHTWLAAAPITAYAILQHLFVLWDNLPNWYNVAVVAIIAPFIVLGGNFWRSAEARVAILPP